MHIPNDSQRGITFLVGLVLKEELIFLIPTDFHISQRDFSTTNRFQYLLVPDGYESHFFDVTYTVHRCKLGVIFKILSHIFSNFLNHKVQLFFSSSLPSGHLAVLKGGGLTLRESAQCPKEDEKAFQDGKSKAS